MKFELQRGFAKRLKGRIEKYQFEVGILEDAPYLEPKRGVHGLKGQEVINIFAGGPVRQKTRIPSGKMISDVSAENRKRLGFNYLSKPFSKRNDDIIKFTKRFFDVVTGRSQPKRLENLLQAIVRNPILRGDYGTNKPLTQKIKGFDRYMIDTGQLFKAIKAVVKRVR